ncbi:hypothetical protein [Mobilicoccus caccae]|uniref:Uncharacterized protein n=1 Tax=Mobilicoccus caccae TaxID=1859295 RepID=A0ABQ6IQU8_9MICO|nr:hypothetical protein [Mobilicoccus caccae]GMA39572.1 hypothetical protein GCM10025883_16170 [Mobilicoccus caccae]
MRRRASALAALTFVVLMGFPAPALATEPVLPGKTTGEITPSRYPDWVCLIIPRLCA